MVRQGRVPLENVIYGISSNIYVKKIQMKYVNLMFEEKKDL